MSKDEIMQALRYLAMGRINMPEVDALAESLAKHLAPKEEPKEPEKAKAKK